MIFDNFLGLVFIALPNAFGKLVSFSQVLLAFTFAPLGFVFQELLFNLVGSCRSISFLVRFPTFPCLFLFITFPFPRVCFSSPGMSLSIVLVLVLPRGL